ncbi:hypothetical protein GIB67_002620 [Kingdonia uniflora]|uniref:GTP-eEF1A C-terminal domain-containing protein n=1 Tax=Kingdonia uniflora TaxID=39325 RepID=A0A7J7N491_9MAGN|nr:hypothetical protein GIB67_002620 [Kingdonia uniflora]
MTVVHSQECGSQPCTVAMTGDNVTIGLQGINVSNVVAGGVLCHPSYPMAASTHLELKILTLDLTMPILIGSKVEFHIHQAKEAARVVKILSVFDQKTGKVSKRAPRCLTEK